MVKDARGRTVPLVGPELAIPGRREPAHRDRLMAAASVSPVTRAEKRRMILMSLATFPVMMAAAVLPPFLLDSRNWWTLLFFVPSAFLPAMIAVFVTRRAMSQRYAETYVRAGFCGSCAYELKGAPAADDGIIACPECGAAWRSPDVGAGNRRSIQ
jgi:hypothetical protein